MNKKTFFTVLSVIFFTMMLFVLSIVVKKRLGGIETEISQLKKQKIELLKNKDILERKLSKYIADLSMNIIELRRRALNNVNIKDLDAWQDVVDTDSIDINRYQSKRLINHLDLDSNNLYHSAGGKLNND